MGQVQCRARANLQTILDNLTAGVIVLDADGVIQSANPGLHPGFACAPGPPTTAVRSSVAGLEDFGQAVQKQFEDYLRERQEHGLDHWQQSFELGARPPAHRDAKLTLVAAALKYRARPGCWCLTTFQRSCRPACAGMGRSGEAPRPRNQEPADASPAFGRAPGNELSASWLTPSRPC